jgi:hypothetical protein
MDPNLPPPNPQGNHAQRRVEAHRQHVNAMVIKKETDAINERLKSHLAYEYFESVKQREAGTSNLVNVPITTRGIGINTQFSHSTLSRRNTKAAQAAPSPTPFYRVAQLQLKKQLYAARREQMPGEFADSAVSDQFGPNFDQKFYSVGKANLALVSSSITSVGAVAYADGIYKAYVPNLRKQKLETTESKARIEHYNQQYAEIIKMSPEQRIQHNVQLPDPPRSEYITLVVPDPYLVTFDNLRDTVIALSNPLCPQIQRGYFHRLCPIPGTRWTEDYVLLNPDEIMPNGYDEFHLMRDNTIVNAFFKLLRAVDASHIMEMPLDGITNEIMLCTTSQQHIAQNNFDEFSALSIEYSASPRLTSRSHLLLNGVLKLMSITSLMSELPVRLDYYDQSEEWSLRSPRISISQLQQSWTSLVDSIMSYVK